MITVAELPAQMISESRDTQGKITKTGKILGGDEALASLIAVFGHVENMKVFLHPDKSEQALAMADPDIADRYQAVSSDPQP